MSHLLLIIIYVAAIGLGLPDSLLGSAWPTMCEDLTIPLSGAGLIYMIVTAGTIICSLSCERLTKLFGSGLVTVASIGLTAFAIFGYSISSEFWHICLFAIPYGVGAGGVDAVLGNYMATHYSSRHMSWMHGIWGIGTIIGPNILSFALANGMTWHDGYRYIFILQAVITTILILALPLWKSQEKLSLGRDETERNRPLTLKETIRIPGAKELFISFFCYGALEQTTALWASSYMVLHCGIDTVTAARYASIFYIGITIGRFVSGLLTIRFSDRQMIRLGTTVAFCGVIALFFPSVNTVIFIGIILIGLGCAPIFPCVLHSTPENFGEDKSQAVMGVQIAVGYSGIFSMPPLFGLIANHISISLYPVFLAVTVILMSVMYELYTKKIR